MLRLKVKKIKSITVLHLPLMTKKNWWWPTGRGYWPNGVSRTVTLDAFTAAFQTLGYNVCENELYEEGFARLQSLLKMMVPRPTLLANCRMEDGLVSAEDTKTLNMI